MNLADRIPSTLFAKENRSMRKMLVLSVVFALATSACGSAPGSGKQGKALAVVNGEILTEATLMKEGENLPPYVRPILETPAGRAQFLESVITRDLLMREALRRGIDRRPEAAGRIAMARKSIVLEALLRGLPGLPPLFPEPSILTRYSS